MRTLRVLALLLAAGGLGGCYDYGVRPPSYCRAVWVRGHYDYYWTRWHPGHWRCG
jgi:hypothetical protein